MCRHGKCEPHIHPTRIALYRRVKKCLHLGECHDFVKSLADLALRVPKDRAVKKDVFATRELRMKTCSDLEQACDASAQQDPPLCWRSDAAQNLEQRALAGAVATNDPDGLAVFDLEANVLERPKFLHLVALNNLSPMDNIEGFARKTADFASDDVPQRRVFVSCSPARSVSKLARPVPDQITFG